MGVYIRDMEMPKECEFCFLVEKCEQRHYEMMKDEDGDYMLRLVKDNCPLVEVPTPHGRLIDADEIVKDLRHDVAVDQDMLDYEELTSAIREMTQADKVVKQNAAEIIESTPTVIEGSK